MKTYLYRAADAMTSGGALGALCGAFFFVGKGRDDAATKAVIVVGLLLVARAALRKFAGHVFDEYAGCCGCGTVRKVDRFVVWYGSKVDMTECYCGPCLADIRAAADPGDLDGFTFAAIGPVVTVAEYRQAAADAFPTRLPHPPAAAPGGDAA